MNKIIDINDLPKPEDFIITSSTGLDKADLKNKDKENLDEVLKLFLKYFPNF
jgi:hypothetical protein